MCAKCGQNCGPIEIKLCENLLPERRAKWRVLENEMAMRRKLGMQPSQEYLDAMFVESRECVRIGRVLVTTLEGRSVRKWN